MNSDPQPQLESDTTSEMPLQDQPLAPGRATVSGPAPVRARPPGGGGNREILIALAASAAAVIILVGGYLAFARSQPGSTIGSDLAAETDDESATTETTAPPTTAATTITTPTTIDPADDTLATLTVDPDRVALLVGDGATVALTGLMRSGMPAPPEVIDAASWFSSDPSVATVDNGTIAAIAPGEVEGTVVIEDIAITFEVIVIAEVGSQDPGAGRVLEGDLFSTPVSLSVEGNTATITFSTSACTAVRYSGSGLDRESPGFPDASERCFPNHRQVYENLAPGTYNVTVEVVAEDGSRAVAAMPAITIS
ncbi:MAG: hypothetical protein AAF467_18860 [Actinomycetota bacterium]